MHSNESLDSIKSFVSSNLPFVFKKGLHCMVLVGELADWYKYFVVIIRSVIHY